MKINNTQELKEQFEIRAAANSVRIECGMYGSMLSEIAVVGEAPGNAEVSQGSPLVGMSGRLLWDSMTKFAGVKRSDCYATNVCKRQVSFEVDEQRKTIGKNELAVWQSLILWELAQLPNLRYIVALGNIALEALTGHSGITKWRGSVLYIELGERRIPVLCTNSPAMAIREPKTGITMNMDLTKLKRLLNGTFKPFEVITHINPTYEQALDYLHMLRSKRQIVGYDIETMNGETACIGFAHSIREAMCINFRRMMQTENGLIHEHAFSPDQERMLRRQISKTLNDPNVRLVAQNNMFDASWLRMKDRINVQPVHFDTMLAHHTLYPTFPHNLGFLTTQYTDHAYYKDEKNDWREIGEIDNFWRYNGKDCAHTVEIHYGLLNELRNDKLDKFFFEHVQRLQPHLIRMTVGGLAVDAELKKRITNELEITLEQKLAKFHAAVQKATSDPDYRPNPQSPRQLSELFFSKLKLVGRGTSTDALNREQMFKHPRTSDAAREVITAINEYKEDQKFYSTYATSVVDEDGRIRCEYKQIGVQNAPGRLSSTQTPWQTGMNLQNQPDRAKDMFVADEGYCFIYIDGSQAEARVVGWRYTINQWIEQFERSRIDGSYDAHRALAADMFKVAYDKVPTFDRYDIEHPIEDDSIVFPGNVTMRFVAKRCRHGLNYRMAADKLSLTTGLPISVAQDAYTKYHRINPEVKRGWSQVEQIIKSERMLFNALGRRYLQLEPPGPDNMDSIVAFYPQSTVGDQLCRVIYKSHDDPKWPRGARIVLNIHDALIAIAPVGEPAKQALRIMVKHAEEPLQVQCLPETYGKPLGAQPFIRELIIPADAAMSQPDEHGVHRWSTIRKIKKKDLYK